MIDNFLPLLRGDKRHKQGRNAVIREEGGADLVGATVLALRAGRSARTAACVAQGAGARRGEREFGDVIKNT